MSEKKHTPGPWILNGEKECFDPDFNDGDDRGYYAMSRNPEIQIHDPIPANRYADACLIAAAPDLLAAMQRYLPVLEWLEANPRLWFIATKGTGLATLNGYKAAISKAVPQ